MCTAEKSIKKIREHVNSRKRVKLLGKKSPLPKYCNLGSKRLIVLFLKVYLFILMQFRPIFKRDISQRAEMGAASNMNIEPNKIP